MVNELKNIPVVPVTKLVLNSNQIFIGNAFTT